MWSRVCSRVSVGRDGEQSLLVLLLHDEHLQRPRGRGGGGSSADKRLTSERERVIVGMPVCVCVCYVPVSGYNLTDRLQNENFMQTANRACLRKMQQAFKVPADGSKPDTQRPKNWWSSKHGSFIPDLSWKHLEMHPGSAAPCTKLDQLLQIQHNHSSRLQVLGPRWLEFDTPAVEQHKAKHNWIGREMIHEFQLIIKAASHLYTFAEPADQSCMATCAQETKWHFLIQNGRLSLA